MKKKKSDISSPTDSYVVMDSLQPGWGDRISEAAKLWGTRQNAALAAGVATDTLQRYIRESVQPSFEALVRLALPVGVSLEWIATGKEAASSKEACLPDKEVLTDAILFLERGLYATGRSVVPSKRAALTIMIYELLLQDKDVTGEEQELRTKALLREGL